MPYSPIVSTDTGYTFTITWQDDSGAAVNLTGATVTLRLQPLPPSTAATFAATGTITLTTPASGIFTFVPSATDVSTAASYSAQFRAVLSGGGILHTDVFQLAMVPPI